jgi:trehalose-phosphatase
LLDYDGTLAPFAPHPDLALLPPETKHVLQRLSNLSDVYIAIISGRDVDNVKKMVGIEGMYEAHDAFRMKTVMKQTYHRNNLCWKSWFGHFTSRRKQICSSDASRIRGKNSWAFKSFARFG